MWHPERYENIKNLDKLILKMNLIILASIKGSRLKKLTKNNPKCLLKIKGLDDYSKNFRKFKSFQKNNNCNRI